ncbi:hypothetical protein MTR_3g068135 [Medicago truncatula]|uniref:Uncharacterized protein n=1 Tax=Medicago truncatula TaxID=3880 RepID=A0A072UZ76_MEDTR|nr:hypothetical protein MTR_3g068135 [Medicago truncatula]
MGKVIDVIGHVIERDNIRETDKNGQKSRVIDLTLEDLEMKSAAIQLTQGVSQVSMHSSMSLSDDLLKTKRMMIENLIESSELCHVPNGVEWYFRSCTNCASLVTIFEVKLCCKKCSTCKSDVPMYIHHLIFKGMKILVTDEEETTVMRYIDVAINCNEVEETTNHLFLHCTKTWKVLRRHGTKYEITKKRNEAYLAYCNVGYLEC